MPAPLTAKQRKLMKELDEISQIVRVDYWNIRERAKAARTPVLQVMIRELIRGKVVGQYTLIDDLLSTEVCRYFLPGSNLIQQWKTKRFRRFNYYVIERLYLTHKWSSERLQFVSLVVGLLRVAGHSAGQPEGQTVSVLGSQE